MMKENQEGTQPKKAPQQKGQDPFQPKGPRDGLDNTGTQGYDSLKDDGYIGSSKKPAKNGHEDGTGSASKDFHTVPPDKDVSAEDRALDSGI